MKIPAIQNFIPLFEIKRNGVTERALMGAAVVIQGAKQSILGDFDPIVFGRSLTKPFQMKAIAHELADVLSAEEKSIAISSHSGSSEHLAVVSRILPNLSVLKLPASMPLGPSDILEKSQLAHPCSGKHAAILKACDLNHWPLDSYLENYHPYNQAYRRELEKALGRSLADALVAKDGCWLPTYAMPLSDLCKLFSYLALHQEDDWIWQAFRDNPYLVGGAGRLDTVLMQHLPGFIAKEGADGLLAVALTQGTSLVIKTAHGFDPLIAWHVVDKILAALGKKAPPPPAFLGQQIHWSETFNQFLMALD